MDKLVDIWTTPLLGLVIVAGVLSAGMTLLAAAEYRKDRAKWHETTWSKKDARGILAIIVSPILVVAWPLTVLLVVMFLAWYLVRPAGGLLRDCAFVVHDIVRGAFGVKEEE